MRRRLIISGGGSPAAPSSISAVSSWFRLASPNTVITGSGYSSVADVLNPASPATQGTDALRPPNATSANGLPIMTVASSAMSIPIIAGRDGTSSFGFWGWFRRTGGTFVGRINGRAISGASADRFDTISFPNLADLYFHSLNGAGADSIVQVTNGSVLNAWQLETYEYNGAGATDADKAVITVNGVVQTATSIGAAFPASLTAATGTMSFLASQLTGVNPFVGSSGPNFGFLGAPMAGVTAGILTPAARTALFNFERPT